MLCTLTPDKLSAMSCDPLIHPTNNDGDRSVKVSHEINITYNMYCCLIADIHGRMHRNVLWEESHCNSSLLLRTIEFSGKPFMIIGHQPCKLQCFYGSSHQPAKCTEDKLVRSIIVFCETLVCFRVMHFFVIMLIMRLFLLAL